MFKEKDWEKWEKIIKEKDYFEAKEALTKAYNKGKKETEASGDLLYWMGVCHLIRAYKSVCSTKIGNNLSMANEYFRKSLKEYPKNATEKIFLVSKTIKELNEITYQKEKIKELLNSLGMKEW